MIMVQYRSQIVVLVGIFLIALMGLFPPWIGKFDKGGFKRSAPIGYYSIFDPPPKNAAYQENVVKKEWIETFAPESRAEELNRLRDIMEGREVQKRKVTGGYYKYTDPYKIFYINFYQVGMQWAVVAIATGGLLYTFREKKTS